MESQKTMNPPGPWSGPPGDLHTLSPPSEAGALSWLSTHISAHTCSRARAPERPFSFSKRENTISSFQPRPRRAPSHRQDRPRLVLRKPTATK